MKSGKSLGHLCAFTLVAITGATAIAADFRQGEDVNVTGEFTDSLFVAGNHVRADLNSTDNVFMAARSITQAGGTSENLILAGGKLSLHETKARTAIFAGGTLTIDNAEFRDLLAAGGDVNIERAEFKNDLVLAGGRVDISPNARIRDSLLLAAGSVNFAGDVGGDAVINGNDIVITGKFAKSLRVRAEHLTIAPGARIEGDFIHDVENLQVASGAQIIGRSEVMPKSDSDVFGESGQGWAIIGGLLFATGVLLAPAVVSLVFPRFTLEGGRQMHAKFWESVGIGVLVVIVVPIVLAILSFSVIGTPLGLFAIPFVFTGALLAWTIAVFALGENVRAWYLSRRHREITHLVSRSQVFRFTLLGTAVLLFALWIPIAGILIALFLFLAAVGAIFNQMIGRHPKPFEPSPPTPQEHLVPAGAHT